MTTPVFALTDAQERALRKVSEGPATAGLVGVALGHGSIGLGTSGRAVEAGRTVLESLDRKGLVRSDGNLWRITPAGRKALGDA